MLFYWSRRKCFQWCLNHSRSNFFILWKKAIHTLWLPEACLDACWHGKNTHTLTCDFQFHKNCGRLFLCCHGWQTLWVKSVMENTRSNLLVVKFPFPKSINCPRWRDTKKNHIKNNFLRSKIVMLKLQRQKDLFSFQDEARDLEKTCWHGILALCSAQCSKHNK